MSSGSLRRTSRLVPGSQDLESFEASIVPDTLEGGFDAKEFLETNKAHLQTVPQVLDLAMMLETQALDLYLRFADRCEPAADQGGLVSPWPGRRRPIWPAWGCLLEEKLGKRG